MLLKRTDCKDVCPHCNLAYKLRVENDSRDSSRRYLLTLVCSNCNHTCVENYDLVYHHTSYVVNKLSYDCITSPVATIGKTYLLSYWNITIDLVTLFPNDDIDSICIDVNNALSKIEDNCVFHYDDKNFHLYFTSESNAKKFVDRVNDIIE